MGVCERARTLTNYTQVSRSPASFDTKKFTCTFLFSREFQTLLLVSTSKKRYNVSTGFPYKIGNMPAVASS